MRDASSRRIGLFPPLPLSALGAHPSAGLPFPLDRRDCRVYSRARQGLWQGVRALGLGPGDEILVPAYHQGSEVEAFTRAGLDCRYYETTELLEPDPAQLDRALSRRTRALHVIHYWGMPQDAVRWRAWCDERELLLIEDGAQALLARRRGRDVGSLGDLAVFCLYKAFGLPDGAAAVCRVPLPPPGGWAGVGLVGAGRRLGAGLAQRNALFARLQRFLAAEPTVRNPGEFLDGEFELGDPDRPAALSTRWLVPRLLDAAAAERRRHNYRALLERLRPLVPTAFRDLDEGASPIAFPVEVRDRDALAGLLAEVGIDSGCLWPTWHPSLPVERFPIARRFRHDVLALPVHQELADDNIEHIAGTVERVATPL